MNGSGEGARACRAALAGRAHHKTGARLGAVSYCREVIERGPAQLLRSKLLLQDVHAAVWRRIKLADSLSTRG